MADYFTDPGDPITNSAGESSVIRAIFTSLAAGFAKIAGYTGNGGKIIAINAGGTAQEAITTTGTGSGVRATSPTLVTPLLGTPTSVDLTNATGTAAGLTAGNVTTNANLTGDVTSAGNATTIGAGKVTEAMQVLADNTTNNASTTKHGYVPKVPNVVTQFLDGTGAFSTPVGTNTAAAHSLNYSLYGAL